MLQKLKRITIILISFVLASLVLLAAINWWGTAKLNRPFDSDKLTADDHRQISEVIRLKEHFGENVWPEFKSAEIPIVLYNDIYEFVVGLKEAPIGWEAVDRDHFHGELYYRRRKRRSEAFAIKINNTWAGSLDSREYLSHGFLLKLREELPPILAQLFPYWFLTVDEGFHAVLVLHEIFHAFQAIRAPNRFVQAMDVYKYQKDYPFQNSEFTEAWNREGALLSSALDTKDRSILCNKVDEFLRIRKARRAGLNLSSELVNFERALEWLEGLAKYTEIRFYELAAASDDESLIAKYDINLRRWFDEFRRLRSNLGEQKGDFRFYLSGMAQARLLDRLLPNWKENAFDEGVYLEYLLETACYQ